MTRLSLVAHALEQVAVRDPGGGEEHVVPGHEVLGREHAGEVVALLESGGALGVVAGPQAAEDLAAEALERAGRDHALGRAADPEEDVGAGSGPGHRDRAGHVAVRDEPDPGPRLAAGPDDVGMAVAVEDHRGDVLDPLALGLRDRVQVGLHRGVEVDDVTGLRTHRDLVHVDAGARVEHGAALGERDHRDGVVAPERGERRAVDRVDRDVAGRAAGADLLAVEQHGRLVLLALTDHHHALHRHGVEHEAHGVDRGAVGAVLVAPTQPTAGRQRGGLGGPGQVHGEVAVGSLLLIHGAAI
jgi:hypothetical protein